MPPRLLSSETSYYIGSLNFTVLLDLLGSEALIPIVTLKSALNASEQFWVYKKA